MARIEPATDEQVVALRDKLRQQGGQTDAELLRDAAGKATVRGDYDSAEFFSTAAADHEQGVCGSPGADCYAVTSARRYITEGGAR